MQNSQSQTKILAQAIYEIRLMLSGYLGSNNGGDILVRKAAHLSYALHNEALSVIEDGTFDSEQAVAKVRSVDCMFGESFLPRFEAHLSNESHVNESTEVSIHDNRLISYEVFCQRREICLHTEFRDREPFEFTDVIFTGVTAYDFWHDSDIGTVIFDIIKVPADDIYAEHAEQLRDGVRYGWPGDWAESSESAATHFQKHAIRGFKLSSSCGMAGWILACDMQKRLGESHRNV